MSKIYYVHFSGLCEIEANSIEKARKKFWDYIYGDKPLPKNEYEIELIDEIEDKEKGDKE